MYHTIDTLAHALRGWPRDSPILVRLPDGTLGRVSMVEVSRVDADAREAARGKQAVVLVVE